MAKGQKRSNREHENPKQPKAKAAIQASQFCRNASQTGRFRTRQEKIAEGR
jgi:hypothetical protein